MNNPTNPDQGDERRALSILATFVHETWAGAYSWSELEHKARTALERAGLLSLQDVLALSAALAAPQPSQGANVKVGGSTVYVTNNHRRESNRWWATVYPGFDDDDKRVSTEECDAIAKRIADALNAAPHPPVSAEAGKGVEPGWNWMTHPDWNTGQPIPVRIFTEEGVTYYQPFDMDGTDFEWEIRDEQWQEVSPSESVAVSGEVSERVAKCSAILTLIDNYAPEKLGTAERTHLAVAVDAVLALAGSGGKA